MNNYQIITDATCDMNQEILDQKDILVMPMEIVMDDGQIFQHFGHPAQFKVYEVVDGKLVDAKVVDTNGKYINVSVSTPFLKDLAKSTGLPLDHYSLTSRQINKVLNHKF